MITIIWAWGHRPLIPACGRQRQEYLCEFEANLVDRVSYRIARDIQRNPVSKNQKKKKNTKKKLE